MKITVKITTLYVAAGSVFIAAAWWLAMQVTGVLQALIVTAALIIVVGSGIGYLKAARSPTR
jgi:hypothetical protein